MQGSPILDRVCIESSIKDFDKLSGNQHVSKPRTQRVPAGVLGQQLMAAKIRSEHAEESANK